MHSRRAPRAHKQTRTAATWTFCTEKAESKIRVRDLKVRQHDSVLLTTSTRHSMRKKQRRERKKSWMSHLEPDPYSILQNHIDNTGTKNLNPTQIGSLIGAAARKHRTSELKRQSAAAAGQRAMIGATKDKSIRFQ